MLKQFYLDEQYITEVTVRKEYCYLSDPVNPTPEDLIMILKGQHKTVSISSKDHDEFTKLRNHLEDLGYIKCERGWWNGDRVLKSFKLNEWTFRKGHRFPCALAMKSSIDGARKHNWKSISSY